MHRQNAPPGGRTSDVTLQLDTFPYIANTFPGFQLRIPRRPAVSGTPSDMRFLIHFLTSPPPQNAVWNLVRTQEQIYSYAHVANPHLEMLDELSGFNLETYICVFGRQIFFKKKSYRWKREFKRATGRYIAGWRPRRISLLGLKLLINDIDVVGFIHLSVL